MKKAILLFVTILVAGLSFAQNQNVDEKDPFSEDVKKCIKSNGTYDYYANVVDQMFTMLQQQYQSKNVPQAVWTELKELKTASLDELSEMMVSAYRGIFTHQDVKNMNNLYATQAGKNMFKKASELTDADKVVLTEFYKSETGEKIMNSQEVMNGLMSKISEMWSSSFYKQVVSKLSEKGYNM